MQLEDYINILRGRLDRLGNVDVCMTESGYYSDGPFAELYAIPEMKSIKINDGWKWIDGEHVKTNEPEYKDFLVLGNSHQSY